MIGIYMHYLYYLASITKPPSLPNTTATPDKITTILQVLFVLMGSIALLMVTIGAFKYVLSQGEPTAVKSAKNTIMYAVIGLVVALSAWSIVTFVIKALF